MAGFNLGKQKKKRQREQPASSQPLKIISLTRKVHTHYPSLPPSAGGQGQLEQLFLRFADADKIVVGTVDGALGKYSITRDTIHIIASEMTEEWQYLTLLHELGHMAGGNLKHPSLMQYSVSRKNKTIEEITADLVAIALWNYYHSYSYDDAAERVVETYRRGVQLWEYHCDMIFDGVLLRIDWIREFGVDVDIESEDKGVAACY